MECWDWVGRLTDTGLSRLLRVLQDVQRPPLKVEDARGPKRVHNRAVRRYYAGGVVA
jgi:hypothetical protein